MSNRSVWFARNEQGEALEAEGKIREALALYEANVAEGCDTAFTYERMANLYRNLGEPETEVAALEQALALERKRGITSHLVRTEQRLAAAQALHQEAGAHASRSPTRPLPVRTSAAMAQQQKKGCFSSLGFAVLSVGLLWHVLA